MFGKNQDEELDYEKIEPTATFNDDQPDTGEQAQKNDGPQRKISVIGPTLKFKGELSANEDLIIEGEIEGTIAHQEKNLTVGREGRVKANIDAKTVEVYGRVEGDINAEDHVKLARSSDVKGNITCAKIVMEDGALFSGNIDMSGKPKKSSEPTALPIAGKPQPFDTAS